MDQDNYFTIPPYDPRKWDFRFLNLADYISSWSYDPSTKTGAVIVDSLKRVISLGYNGFPRNVPDNKNWYENRERKVHLVCHADRNALDNAPCDVRGMTLYITHSPCVECQKSIIQKGIGRVVWWKSDDGFSERWKADSELLQLSQTSYKIYSKEDELDYLHQNILPSDVQDAINKIKEQLKEPNNGF